MAQFQLKWRERRVLEQLARETQDATILRRAQALLWLHHGESAASISLRLGVSRQVIYQWIGHFRQDTTDGTGDLASRLRRRLAVRPRAGRPRTVQGVIDPLLDTVLEQDPRECGCNSTVWTAALLQEYLQQEHHLVASVPSIRLALARLDWHWKRPRHQLQLRTPTWRQAKGGLKRGSANGPAPSC